MTKSRLVLRDLDILTGRNVRLAVTITTSDESYAQIWEPKASSVSDRVEVLRRAKAAGLETAVMLGPLLPGISDTDDALAKLFMLAAETGVNQVWTDVLNPRPRVWPSVQRVLRRHCPDMYDHYRRLMFEPACRREYQRQLDKRIRKAAADVGLASRLA